MKAVVFFISFLLAFLLFSVQPMATKMVLPTLGGTPAVWNTAMLTFQLLLLAGYAYAHLLTQKIPTRHQWWMHGLLVLGSFALLPLSVSLVNSEALVYAPIRHLAAALILQIGLPFFVLSATAPLLQAWVSRSAHSLSRTPYVLYSASNLGSMSGLLSYIILVEPQWGLNQQSLGWSAAYVIGTLALVVVGRQLKPLPVSKTVATIPFATPIRWQRYALWMWLAFLPSALSLGVTSYITTDIASVPLIWVLPLALYLLSFVDAFRAKPLLVEYCIRLAPITALGGLLLYFTHGHQFTGIFLIQLLVFAVLAFALHGWLARHKPQPQQLTQFYFCLSIGGALGGVLNAIVAPLVFNEAYEYPISLLLAGLTAFALTPRLQQPLRYRMWRLSIVALTMLVASTLLYLLLSYAQGNSPATISDARLSIATTFAALFSVLVHRTRVSLFYSGLLLALVLLATGMRGSVTDTVHFRARSFFGIWRVFDKPAENARYMMHNTTVHSAQFMKQVEPLQLLSYYYPLTEAFRALPALRTHPAALLGLGAGTVQCLMQPHQQMDIFEIDPIVVQLAQDPAMFRYLSECPGTHQVFLGDGRLELAEQEDQRYGAIMLDAFSSDSIPTHLMTLEAMRMYLDKLVPGGAVLIHTTNRHIELWPLIATQAQALGAVAYGKYFTGEDAKPLRYRAFWVVLANDEASIVPLVAQGWKALTPDPNARPWTDNYSNMLPYFRILRD